MKLLLVGAGQIGSRHLQGLASLKEADIAVCDPSPQSLKVASERFEQVRQAGSKIRVDYLEKLPHAQYDMAIIATDAKVRLQALKETLTCTSVTKVLLEKVVFQSPKDFSTAESLLRETGVRAWVNCPMRLWSGYLQMKESLSEPIRLSVSGSRWGLACNAIHYLDLFCFLSGRDLAEIKTAGLDSQIRDSKRPGYYEVSGSIEGVGGGGHDLVRLESFWSGNSPVCVDIETSMGRYRIREDLNSLTEASDRNGWKDTVKAFPIPFQSQLSGKIALDLLENDRCLLPTYEESAQIHLKLLSALSPHFSPLGLPEGVCPIT